MIKNGYNVSYAEAQKMTDHFQVKVWTPDDVEVHVDLDLAELLIMLWDLGYETRYSCQGTGKPILNDGRDGYIYFKSSEMVDKFSETVMEELMNRYENIDEIENDFEVEPDYDDTVYFRSELIPLFVEVFSKIDSEKNFVNFDKSKIKF